VSASGTKEPDHGSLAAAAHPEEDFEACVEPPEMAAAPEVVLAVWPADALPLFDPAAAELPLAPPELPDAGVVDAPELLALPPESRPDGLVPASSSLTAASSSMLADPASSTGTAVPASSGAPLFIPPSALVMVQ
jgi:hypothetical protein